MRRLLLLLCFVVMAGGRISAQETIQVKATGVGITSELRKQRILVSKTNSYLKKITLN